MDTLDYDEFRKFFFALLRQNDLERLLISYLYKTYNYEEIDPIKDERISTKKFLEFMEAHQKNSLSMDEYKELISYFDETADDQSLSVQGRIAFRKTDK